MITVHVIDEGEHTEDTGPTVRQEAISLEMGTDVVEVIEAPASLGQSWHFMRETYPWLDFVQHPAEIDGKSKIGNFEPSSHGMATGQVCQDQNGYYYYAYYEEGRIRLDQRSNRRRRK